MTTTRMGSRGGAIEITCTHCGKSVLKYRSHATSPIQFCSRKCKTAHNRRPIIDNGDGTSSVVLACGSVSIIDTEDKELAEGRNWYKTNHGYVMSRINKRPTLLHRLILNAQDGVEVDHIDRDRLNNRKSNLRTSSRSENARNQGKRTGQWTSKYKGVYHNGISFIARITIENEGVHIGSFKTEEEAAIAYNNAALEIHGAFASINEVEP